MERGGRKDLLAPIPSRDDSSASPKRPSRTEPWILRGSARNRGSEVGKGSSRGAMYTEFRIWVNLDLRSGRAGQAAPGSLQRFPDYWIFSSSTSKNRVAFGGITPPAPRAP